MVVFFRQFFSSESIAQVWNDVFLFLKNSPLGVLISMCLISFILYLFCRVLFK